MECQESEKLYRCYYNSPIGLLLLQANDLSIKNITFIQEKKFNENKNGLLKNTIHQLNQYFNGVRMVFDLPIRYDGTNFQNKVWEALRQIEYGKTSSYKEIAEKIKHPKAYRAVGSANNKNKLPIIIPCHRVIGIKGDLTGYAGGIWRKKWLIEHEKKVIERKGI